MASGGGKCPSNFGLTAFSFFPAMAMTTKPESRRTSLKRRIRQFYNLLNQRDFRRCHEMIDPRIRLKPSSVTLLQYQNSLGEFLDEFGPVDILDISVSLHLNEPSELYEGRDFALGKTVWTDEAGDEHLFAERWVFEGRAWFTRSTGFVTPARVEVIGTVARSKKPSTLVRIGKPKRRIKG